MKKNKKQIAVNTRFLIHNKLEGIGYFTFECLKRIVNSHPEIDFYFLFDRNYSEEFIFATNVKAVILVPPARHPFLWLCWFEFSVSRWLNKNKPDLFLSPDGFGCLRTSIPQVLVMHDIAYEHFNDHLPFLSRIYYRYFMPRFARKAKRIATVSEFSKQDIMTHYNIPSESIDVVYSGAKEGYIPVNEQIKEKVKERYTGGKNYFLFVGLIHPRKNIQKLLEGFEQFKEDYHSDHQLIVVGRKAWGYDEITDILSTMKYRNEVLFLGYLPVQELMEVTAAAECMVFVSLFEGFGVPIIEAMKCNVPVITSNISSMSEIAGNAAILVNPTSTNEIAAAMKQISSDPDLRNILIEKGKIQAKKFSWDITSLKLWECCERVL